MGLQPTSDGIQNLGTHTALVLVSVLVILFMLIAGLWYTFKVTFAQESCFRPLNM